MQLVERGSSTSTLRLPGTSPTSIPENPFGGEITLRQLTSHRAGLTREPPVGHYFDDTEPTLAATVASLNRTSLIYPAGHSTPNTPTPASRCSATCSERTQEESFYPYLQHAVLEPLGMRASAFQPTAELRRRPGQGLHVDARRPTLRGADVSARHGAGRQPVHHRARSRPLHVGPVRRGRAPRRQAAPGRATLDSMWTPQFAEPGAHHRVRHRLRYRHARRPSHRRTRRRHLWLCHLARGAARRFAGRGRGRDARRDQRGDRCHRRSGAPDAAGGPRREAASHRSHSGSADPVPGHRAHGPVHEGRHRGGSGGVRGQAVPDTGAGRHAVRAAGWRTRNPAPRPSR